MTAIRLILDWNMVLQDFYDPSRPGAAIEPTTLPLSKETIDALLARYKHWGRVCLDASEPGDSPLDEQIERRFLDDEGLQLWKRVVTELGQAYTVHYYSEVLHRTFGTIKEYQQFAG
jgi:hypothetical protein